tara:strand:+ start:955 stop:1728 length:774 start_codon:yes stop_codon:yes gene_type:complete
MTDRRLTPDPSLVTGSDPRQVTAAVADLYRSPDGARDRQLIFGDAVAVLNDDDGWAYVQAKKDGYCGHVRPHTLGPPVQPTHRVSVPATHAYARADLKSPDRISLSFGSQVTVLDDDDPFAKTTLGHIPKIHLQTLDTVAKDPAEIAALFLGTPYLWGGNSRWGIDCSGLVQAALLACGIPCPGDSDQQQILGEAARGSYRRNDLLFWKGHVALVTDPHTLIHANAHAMQTTHEPIVDTIARIRDKGDGPVTAHRRL